MFKLKLVMGVVLSLSVLTSVAQKLSPKEVKEVIAELGFKYPDIIYEQYKQESALGLSNLARNHNNLMGMKVYSRGGLSVGKTKSGFSIYNSQRESIIDRLVLEYYSGWHKLSKQQYLKVMRNIYCKNCKDYLDNIN